jgi:hypothetical protein
MTWACVLPPLAQRRRLCRIAIPLEAGIARGFFIGYRL